MKIMASLQIPSERVVALYFIFEKTFKNILNCLQIFHLRLNVLSLLVNLKCVFSKNSVIDFFVQKMF